MNSNNFTHGYSNRLLTFDQLSPVSSQLDCFMEEDVPSHYPLGMEQNNQFNFFHPLQSSNIGSTFEQKPVYDFKIPEDHVSLKSPSILSWEGNKGFEVTILENSNSSSKWNYSNKIKKLFLCKDSAVPIQLSLKNWVDDAFVCILPVYKNPNQKNLPVKRCLNCSLADQNCPDHIVQLEGCTEAVYKSSGERSYVTFPFPRPPHGEQSSTILIKSACLTSCIGGPNRRPFLFVVTLWHKNESIGRQVIDLKCCRCPSRDMKNEMKQAEQRELQLLQENEDKTNVNNRSSHPLCKKIKLETDSSTVRIKVPTEFLPEIKQLINRLVAQDLVTSLNLGKLPYPDQL